METHVRSTPREREENVALNESEFAERRQELRSTPKLVVLGTHNACNAKCVFCLESRYSRFDLQLYKDFFEARMGSYIRNAEKVTFTGWGEILWIPGIEEFLDYINETIPEVWKIFTTNGTPLRPSVVDRLLKSRYVVQASVHASYAALHQELTLLEGEFDNVIGNLSELSRLRREKGLGAQLHIQLVNVLTRRNVDDLPDFVRLAERLRVPELRASHMTMYIPSHIDMSCFFDQDRANGPIAEAERLAAPLRAAAGYRRMQISLPPLFDRAALTSPPSTDVCYDPWQNVYVELQGSVMPCCFWGEHIGNLSQGAELDEIWNGPVYRELRRGMGEGDPHPWCRNCIRYSGWNVNNLYCHLTNRPHQQLAMLEEIQRRGLDAGAWVKPGDVERLRRAVAGGAGG